MGITKKLNEDIAEAMFVIDEKTKRLPIEEQAFLGSFWVTEEEAPEPEPRERYAYAIVDLESTRLAPEEEMCSYGERGYRIVHICGRRRHLIIMEKIK